MTTISKARYQGPARPCVSALTEMPGKPLPLINADLADMLGRRDSLRDRGRPRRGYGPDQSQSWNQRYQRLGLLIASNFRAVQQRGSSTGHSTLKASDSLPSAALPVWPKQYHR